MNTANIEESVNNSAISNGICRLCGRKDLNLIDVFSEEGLRNDLANKVEIYIPIKLLEHPIVCCTECQSAILSWHEFICKILKANRRSNLADEKVVCIRSVQNTSTRDLSQSSLPSLHAFHQESPESLLNKTNTKYILKDSDEETDAHNCISESSDSTKYSDEDSETGLDLKNKTPIIKHDACSDIIQTENILNANNPEYSDVFEEDFQHKINDKIQGIRNKIDPKIIEEAKVVVGDRTYYNCKECGKSLLSPYTYVWHMRIHTGERPFMCDLCGKQFRVSQGLVRHLKETHKRIKNFPCDLCGRMFATKRNVDEHRRIHTNERPYVCALCSKSFKQKASLFVHNRIHSNSFPFKCEYCSQGFRTKPPLLIHVTKHTGQKPYPCDICGRCFRIKYELKRHKLVHSEEKPFVCPSCGLRFKQNRYLRNHLKTNHTNGT